MAEEFEGIRDRWNSWPGSRNSDLDSLFAICRSKPAIVQPYGLFIYQGQTPTTGLVGRVERRRIPLRLGAAKFLGPEALTLTFPHGALRGDPSDEDCDLLAGGISSTLNSRAVDLVIFDHICVESRLFQSLKHASAFPFRDLFSPVRIHWKRVFSDGHDIWRSKRERRHFLEIEKRLQREFSDNIEVKLFKGDSELHDVISDIDSVAAKSWQRKKGCGFHASRELINFLKAEAHFGRLCVYLLYINRVPRAFLIGTTYQNTFYADYMAYDTQFSVYSPGTFVLFKAMNDLFRQGVSAFDFGFTDDEYKRRVGNMTIPETSLHLFAPRLKGFCLSLARASILLVSEGARSVLHRARLLHRAKMLWRKIG